MTCDAWGLGKNLESTSQVFFVLHYHKTFRLWGQSLHFIESQNTFRREFLILGEEMLQQQILCLYLWTFKTHKKRFHNELTSLWHCYTKIYFEDWANFLFFKCNTTMSEEILYLTLNFSVLNPNVLQTQSILEPLCAVVYIYTSL